MKYYWLKKQLDNWQSSLNSDRKPQAVIISGSQGMGKVQLLNVMVANMMCRKSEVACGQCQNCSLNQQQTHPDVKKIEPENNLIKVKMIRELTQFFVSTPHCSDHKVAVIDCADQMNAAAANALLKVLEEPPSRGLLFLVTDSKHRLMPTIRSRCVTLDVTITNEEKAQLSAWLKDEGSWEDSAIDDALLLAGFQPLKALNLLQSGGLSTFMGRLDLIHEVVTDKVSVSQAAKTLSENESYDMWQLLLNYFAQLVKVNISDKPQAMSVLHPLNQLVKNKPKVLHIIVKFTELINMVMINFNNQVKTQLMIEAVLIEFKSELNRWS